MAVIESDDGLRALLLEILADARFEVVGADSVAALPATWRGDVIVADTFGAAYRPASAAETVSELRSRYRAGIVLYTAHSEAKQDQGQLRADAVVLKPFELDRLVGVVRAVASQHRRRPPA